MSKTVLVEQNENPGPPEIKHLKSWLPVDAVINDGRPGIEWLDMSGVAFTEPFFHQTIARVRRERSASLPLITDFDELIRLEKVFDSLPPSGFIFHSSRCGSTLVANSCRALEGALVLAEPPVLDKLISRFFTDTDEAGTKELFYSMLLKCAVSALGQRRFGNERHYFIKFAVASILQFQRIRRIWPTVPALFLYRDPIEVIVSNLQNIPEWMTIESNPATSAAIIGVAEKDLTSVSPEEFCARALGRFYSAAASAQDENSLLCNYDKLSADTLLQLMKFFRVAVTQEEADRIRQNASLHSKDPSKTFQSDGDMKRTSASERVKNLAERWALLPYQRLVRLEEQGTAS